MQRVMAAKRIDVVEKNEVSDRASVEIFTGTSKTVLKDIANVLELQEKKRRASRQNEKPNFSIPL